MEKEPEMSSDVVLVALDDNSKIASGHPYLWPYDYYAETVKKITNGEPTSFGMDIIFTNTVDATGWSNLIDELAESYMAVNPYMVKIGNKNNPPEPRSAILNKITISRKNKTAYIYIYIYMYIYSELLIPYPVLNPYLTPADSGPADSDPAEPKV